MIVVVVVATSGGGSDGSNDCKGVDTTAAQQAGVPTIKLVAAGAAADADCAPSGQVTLGATAAGRQQPNNQTPSFALQANAVHLPPTANGDATCSGSTSPTRSRVPLGQETVDESGNLTGGVPLSPRRCCLLPALRFDPDLAR